MCIILRIIYSKFLRSQEHTISENIGGMHHSEESISMVAFIEEGLKQKTRQNVVVFDRGSRSNAALGNFGAKV